MKIQQEHQNALITTENTGKISFIHTTIISNMMIRNRTEPDVKDNMKWNVRQPEIWHHSLMMIKSAPSGSPP